MADLLTNRDSSNPPLSPSLLIKVALAAGMTIGVASGAPAADVNKYLSSIHRQLGPSGDARLQGSSSTGLYNPGGSADNWALPAFGPISSRAE
jgi:hypothetical protein